MTLRRILFGLALVLVAGLAGVEAAATSSRPTAATKAPKPLKLRETCVRRADRATVVRFRAADGVRLLGVMLGRGPAGVVLAHESGTATLCSWLPYGRTLARRGYRVLVFDGRGHGSSSASRSPSRRFRVDLDVAAAVREMRRRGARSVVLAGGSFGAMASIAAGGSVRPPVDGVVPVSPGVTFRGLDAEAAARRLNVPTLFVVAQEDAGFPEAARTLYDATATQDKRLLVVTGFGHGSDVMALSTEARAAVDRFIDDHSQRNMRMRALAAGVVLIGRTTFSAAQNFINELERATWVTFVGEPSGGSPNHFSNGTPIELPTLGLFARTSRGYYQDSRPDDPRVATEPHVRVDITSADFMAGRDPVLRAALRVRR